MKTVLILRHGKAEPQARRISDFERGLTERGREDARRMGRLLRQEELVPDAVVSSTARRAKETAEAALSEIGYSGTAHFEEELYLAPPKAYVARVSRLGDEVERVLMVGHNPGLEELVFQLTGSDKTLPTAALAVVTVPIECWAEFSGDGRGTLEAFWLPEDVE